MTTPGMYIRYAMEEINRSPCLIKIILVSYSQFFFRSSTSLT